MCICFNACGRSLFGWNCEITHSLTVAGMLRVLVLALGSIKPKPNACSQHSSQRGELSTFFSSICTAQTTIHHRQGSVKSSKVYLGDFWANSTFVTLCAAGHIYQDLIKRTLEFQSNTNCNSMLIQTQCMMLLILLLSRTHRRHGHAQILPPEEELGLAQSSGLSLSHPDRDKVNHPPNQKTHQIQSIMWPHISSVTG